MDGEGGTIRWHGIVIGLLGVWRLRRIGTTIRFEAEVRIARYWCDVGIRTLQVEPQMPDRPAIRFLLRGTVVALDERHLVLTNVQMERPMP
jgi:hypothetical protein